MQQSPYPRRPLPCLHPLFPLRPPPASFCQMRPYRTCWRWQTPWSRIFNPRNRKILQMKTPIFHPWKVSSNKLWIFMDYLCFLSPVIETSLLLRIVRVMILLSRWHLMLVIPFHLDIMNIIWGQMLIHICVCLSDVFLRLCILVSVLVCVYASKPFLLHLWWLRKWINVWN